MSLLNEKNEMSYFWRRFKEQFADCTGRT